MEASKSTAGCLVVAPELRANNTKIATLPRGVVDVTERVEANLWIPMEEYQ